MKITPGNNETMNKIIAADTRPMLPADLMKAEAPEIPRV
jgi:hypothetical protein